MSGNAIFVAVEFTWRFFIARSASLFSSKADGQIVACTLRICRFAERVSLGNNNVLRPRGMGRVANFLIYNCISHSNPTVKISLFEIGDGCLFSSRYIPIIIYKSVGNK